MHSGIYRRLWRRNTMKQTYHIVASPNAKPWELKDALDEYKLDI